MGTTRRRGSERCAPGCQCGRHHSNTGSFDQNRSNLDAGAATRFKRHSPPPGIGDRFGELTIIGHVVGPAGGCEYVKARCSCGSVSDVAIHNLKASRTTRCSRCGRAEAARSRKNYWGYADIVPDDAHRRRLLNRISACIQRCHNPKSRGYINYGHRGIRVLWGTDKRAFLAYLITLDGWDRPELELDRKEVDHGYEPGNLRFITRTENANNRRKPRKMQQRILDLESENRSLRDRLRHLEYGTAEPLHGVFA